MIGQKNEGTKRLYVEKESFILKTIFMKKIIYIVFLLLGLAAGVLITRGFYANSMSQQKKHTEAVVLLEKIETVRKLITVEGNYIERYGEQYEKPVTFYIPFPATFNFSKKAWIEVQGKVLAGYDMKDVSIALDSVNKTITLSNLPQAEIIAIDHNIKYENFEESFFNSFSEEDYTKMTENAKKVLETDALNDHLLSKAEEQGNAMIDVMKFMVENAGWTLIVKKENPISLPD